MNTKRVCLSSIVTDYYNIPVEIKDENIHEYIIDNGLEPVDSDSDGW